MAIAERQLHRGPSDPSQHTLLPEVARLSTSKARRFYLQQETNIVDRQLRRGTIPPDQHAERRTTLLVNRNIIDEPKGRITEIEKELQMLRLQRKGKQITALDYEARKGVLTAQLHQLLSVRGDEPRRPTKSLTRHGVVRPSFAG